MVRPGTLSPSFNTSTGHVSSTVPAAMSAAAKIPRPIWFHHPLSPSFLRRPSLSLSLVLSAHTIEREKERRGGEGWGLFVNSKVHFFYFWGINYAFCVSLFFFSLFFFPFFLLVPFFFFLFFGFKMLLLMLGISLFFFFFSSLLFIHSFFFSSFGGGVKEVNEAG